MRGSLPTLAWLAAGAVIVLAGCGGDGGDGDETVAGDPTRLRFYDWEPNVIPNPNAPVERATETPFARREDAERVAARTPRCGGGRCIVVAAEAFAAEQACADDSRGYYVLMDRPALTGAELESPNVADDPLTGEPTVSFDFSEPGRKQFAAMTRAVVERGRASAPAGVDPVSASDYSDHFAVVLGDCILSRPIINFAENPNGIDGRAGASIGGGFTREQAEDLAALLSSDAE